MLTDLDRELIAITQAGLPLVERPYEAVAAVLGTTGEVVRERLAAMLDAGLVRRIGAVPNHYRLGYTANGMSVWDVDDARVDELGAQVGALPGVSHCYRRPRHGAAWPYNLFAMLHGRTRAEVQVHADAVAALLGTACRSHDILYSTAILKKTGLRLRGGASEDPRLLPGGLAPGADDIPPRVNDIPPLAGGTRPPTSEA